MKIYMIFSLFVAIFLGIGLEVASIPIDADENKTEVSKIETGWALIKYKPIDSCAVSCGRIEYTLGNSKPILCELDLTDCKDTWLAKDIMWNSPQAVVDISFFLTTKENRKWIHILGVTIGNGHLEDLSAFVKMNPLSVTFEDVGVDGVAHITWVKLNRSFDSDSDSLVFMPDIPWYSGSGIGGVTLTKSGDDEWYGVGKAFVTLEERHLKGQLSSDHSGLGKIVLEKAELAIVSQQISP